MDAVNLCILATQLEITAAVLRKLAGPNHRERPHPRNDTGILTKNWEYALRLHLPVRKALEKLGIKTVGDLTLTDDE